jgi:hypothetical protein
VVSLSALAVYTQMKMICEIDLIDNKDFQGFQRSLFSKPLFVGFKTEGIALEFALRAQQVIISVFAGSPASALFYPAG